MSTCKRVPTALEPYLSLPPELSLILVTGTIACTPTWLLSRFAGATLSQPIDDSTPDEGEARKPETAVVLVSWMRDERFWKTEIRRTTGLDVVKAESQHRFAFVDCLQAPIPTTDLSQQDSVSAGTDQVFAHINATLTKFSSTSTTPRRILLILDQPDVLTGTGTFGWHNLHGITQKLRKQVYATVINCSADLPFISVSAAAVKDARTGSRTATLHTELERHTANYRVQQAHIATFVMACRELATGAAKDVSGVLRVTRGGGIYNVLREDPEWVDAFKETEVLYLVGRDGNVKVFERGASESG
ncbi:hypothetical protein LTR09_009681 [Extremus antarcticus]|uniref:Uncharacterized protein n=1 Tax=Extremus antarcticus TaxID=702011 RepID=A0AAJ0D8G4_9PEZI|nr:hypothetical protein LTR09_009681 [Extremus antarcticus]